MPEKATALQTYSAKDDDELSFMKGDVIEIISKDGDRWWFGRLNGQAGAIPREYIALESYDKCLVEFSYVDVQPGELVLHVGDVIDIIEKSENKWFGKIGDEEGYFHAAFVKEFPKLPPPKPKELEVIDKDFTPVMDFRLTLPKTELLHDARRDRPKKPNVTKRPSRYLSDDYDVISNPSDTTSQEPNKPEESQVEVVEEEIKPIKPPRQFGAMPQKLFADLQLKFNQKNENNPFKTATENITVQKQVINSFQKTTNVEHKFPLRPTSRPSSISIPKKEEPEIVRKPIPQTRFSSVEKVETRVVSSSTNNMDKNKEILKVVEGLEKRMLDMVKDLQNLKKDLQQMQ